jgi:hypothetical protein
MNKTRPSAFRTALITSCCLLSVIFFQLNAGCGGGKESAGGDSQRDTAAAAKASKTSTGRDTDAPNTIRGEVVETMNSGGYTYIQVQTAEDRIWAAGPPSEVEVGETVELPAGMLMHDFHSKTLDRTFETIYFVQSFDAQDIASSDPHEASNRAHGGLDIPADRSASGPGNSGGPISGTKTVADRIVQSELIEKAPGGYTVEEIYNLKKDLAGRTVKVRGVVVKFTPNIMGTNWVHLQDGTGTESSYDLTVTTDATVGFGDLIMMEGVLAVDKDFGAGYRYEVIVEGGELITD